MMTKLSPLVDMFGRPLERPRKPSSGSYPRAESPVREPALRPLPPVPAIEPPPSIPRLPLDAQETTVTVRAMDIAIVHVHGRRVAWSRVRDWSPVGVAVGPEYDRARVLGLAGTTKSPAHEVVRTLLRGARAVLVHGTGSDRLVHVTGTGHKGGSIRTAWSETGAWAPHETGWSAAYQAAQAQGEAGIGYGLAALRGALKRL